MRVKIFLVVIVGIIQSVYTLSSDSLSTPVTLRYTQPAATMGALSYALTGSFYYGTDAALVTGINGRSSVQSLQTGEAVEPGRAHMFTGNAGLLFGLHRSADLGIELPVYVDQRGVGLTRQTFGDLLVSLTVATSRRPSQMSSGGIRLSVSAPTGNLEDALLPRDVYYIVANPGTSFDRGVTFAHNKWFFHPQLLGSLVMKNTAVGLPIEIHMNAGADVTDSRENMALNAAFALVVHPLQSLTFAVEAAGEWRLWVTGRTAADAFIGDPVRCVPSLGFDLPGGVTLTAAGDIGFSSSTANLRSNWHRDGYVYATKSVPQLGGAIVLRYHGSLKSISQRLGSRKAAREAWSAVALPGDRDRDSIPDTLDACPGTPEDRDGYLDTDGCPDYDNDADGIPDEIDKCPDQAEDMDGFNDKDGCPDFDNDGDGILDGIDACPIDSGTSANRGCPESGTLTFVRTVLTAIAFEPGSSIIVSGTDVLDRMFKEMQNSPSSLIEFQVHTDNRGTMENCRLLSQSRADVLKLYLVAIGIRPDRIKALGMGSEFPIADNSTDEGRAKNQRVEVRRIE